MFKMLRRFRNGFIALVVAALPLALVATAPATAGAILITKPSNYSAAETLNRLTKIMESKGITIFARVDHAAGATKIGADLPPTELLIFGNPKLGTPLMAANRSIAIDLPLKALAWTDSEGKTHLSYTDPAALRARWSIKDRDAVFAKITGALDKMTSAATGN